MCHGITEVPSPLLSAVLLQYVYYGFIQLAAYTGVISRDAAYCYNQRVHLPCIHTLDILSMVLVTHLVFDSKITYDVLNMLCNCKCSVT